MEERSVEVTSATRITAALREEGLGLEGEEKGTESMLLQVECEVFLHSDLSVCKAHQYRRDGNKFTDTNTLCILHNKQQTKGYSTGMVDTNKYSHTSHHTRPLPLELVRFTKSSVDAGIQHSNHGCGGQNNTECWKQSRNEVTVMMKFYFNSDRIYGGQAFLCTSFSEVSHCSFSNEQIQRNKHTHLGLLPVP